MADDKPWEDEIQVSTVEVKTDLFGSRDRYSPEWMEAVGHTRLRIEREAALRKVKEKMDQAKAAPLPTTLTVEWVLDIKVLGGIYPEGFEEETLPFEEFEAMMMRVPTTQSWPESIPMFRLDEDADTKS